MNIVKKRLALLSIVFATLATVPQAYAENTWDDVLLIINFNWPHYNNITFFKEIYGPLFPHMVFYGERRSRSEIQVVTHNKGYFAHRTLAHAMRTWPNFNGYLWINDDCFINFWNFAAYDKSKVWRSPHSIEHLDNLPTVWMWWSQPCGYAALKPAYDNLPPHFKDMIVSNLGPSGVQSGFTEMYYFPARYRESVIDLCDRFTNVFLEIALPTICACLCPLDECLYLKGIWTGSSEVERYYSPELDFIHPVKFSSDYNREFARRKIKKNVKKIQR